MSKNFEDELEDEIESLLNSCSTTPTTTTPAANTATTNKKVSSSLLLSPVVANTTTTAPTKTTTTKNKKSTSSSLLLSPVVTTKKKKSAATSRSSSKVSSFEPLLESNNTTTTQEKGSTIQLSQRSMRCILALGLIGMIFCFQIGRFTSSMESEEESTKEQKKSSLFRASSKPKSSTLSVDQIRAAKMEGKNLIKMLDDYYSVYTKNKDGSADAINGQGGAHNMLMGDGGWFRGWNFDKMDTDNGSKESKLIDTMARAIVNSEQKKFIVGLMGSSVAAGHDNCRYDNLSEQFSRSGYDKLWEALGMTLEVQNSGEGGGCGDSQSNQVWCLRQNVSPFADIIWYSWTYFEAGRPKPEQDREMLTRWAQLLPNQPPVHVINVGDRCYEKNPDELKLAEQYENYGYDAFCMRKAFLSGNALYKDNTIDQFFEGGHVGDNYYRTTRYFNETTGQQDRKDSLGVVLRNWHPGPLGFQIISDALIYVYTKAMLLALTQIEEQLLTNNNEEHRWWQNPRPVVLKDDLPKPLFCDPMYCHVDEAPTCLNFELPTYGWHGASIAPPDDSLNPYKGITPQNWMPYLLPHNKAEFMIPKLEQRLFASSEICHFPDNCGGIRGISSDQEGLLVFKLPKMEIGTIILCGCCGKEVAAPMFLNNRQNLEIRYNDKLLDGKWDLFPEKKCVRVARNENSVGSTGHSYLSIKLLPSNREEIIISHVITM